MSKQIDVVGAVILRDGAVFAVQRGPEKALPGMWEFPGGKVEDGETPKDALERELREELLCTADVGDFITTTAYEYSFGTVILSTYFCELLEGEPQLTEHAKLRWVDPSELDSLDWAPADIPAVKIVMEKLAR